MGINPLLNKVESPNKRVLGGLYSNKTKINSSMDADSSSVNYKSRGFLDKSLDIPDEHMKMISGLGLRESNPSKFNNFIVRRLANINYNRFALSLGFLISVIGIFSLISNAIYPIDISRGIEKSNNIKSVGSIEGIQHEGDPKASALRVRELLGISSSNKILVSSAEKFFEEDNGSYGSKLSGYWEVDDYVFTYGETNVLYRPDTDKILYIWSVL